MKTDLSTRKEYSPWDFNHGSIQNTIILGDAILCHQKRIYLYLPLNRLK